MKDERHPDWRWYLLFRRHLKLDVWRNEPERGFGLILTYMRTRAGPRWDSQIHFWHTHVFVTFMPTARLTKDD